MKLTGLNTDQGRSLKAGESRFSTNAAPRNISGDNTFPTQNVWLSHPVTHKGIVHNSF